MADKCPAGAPLWMVTFADLMALLLTLFVLLLTFAEMDVIKYKQLAGSLRDAFGIARQQKLSGMIELDGSIMRDKVALVDPAKTPIPYADVQVPGKPAKFDAPAGSDTPSPDPGKPAEGADPTQPAPPSPAEDLAAQIKKLIAEEIADLGMTVEQVGNEVIIRFPSSIAFPSGSEIITPAFAETMDKLIDVVDKTDGQILISGHTDNIPLSGGKYRSNWELSAARATSVVHWLLDNGKITADRITVQGYGDSRPLVPNDTPENRARNRRVEVSILTLPRKAENGPAPE
ncbi:MAG: OmpA family protein [Magnetospiraceae bacterium]